MAKAAPDLAGHKFGSLLAIERTENIGACRAWLCVCDCGIRVSAKSHALLSGKSKHCGCKKRMDLTGQRYGKLTVLRRGEDKGQHAAWVCLCDCGKEALVSGNSMRSGRPNTVRSCGCLAKNKTLDLTGKRFRRLLVVRFAGRDGRCRMWECLCDCGKTAIVKTRSLRNGDTSSCGCWNIEAISKRCRKPFGEAAFFNLYGSYKRRCIRFGREFTISQAQARQLFSGTCHYCGIPPSMVHKLPGMNGGFPYNGIDRVDNSIGYTPENSVTCCRKCNLAKRDMSYSDFLEWIESVHVYRNRAA